MKMKAKLHIVVHQKPQSKPINQFGSSLKVERDGQRERKREKMR